MESSQLVSWQFESFSTAELSPPTSPVSPSSPLLYDGSNPSSPTGHYNGHKMLPQSQKPVMGSTLTSRAQTASNVLDEIERLHNFDEQNDAFGNCNEESVNLDQNLFEELADFAFTPSVFSSSGEQVAKAAFEVPRVPSPPPSAPVFAPVIPNPDAKLSAEYQAIVESLNNTTTSGSINSNNNLITSFGDLIQIAGIPTTTIVGDECLVPVELVGRPIAGIGPEENESMDLDGIIISNDDMSLINGAEIFSLEELSAELIAEEESSNGSKDQKFTLVNGELPYWAQEMTIPLDELDTEMNRNVNTLDALLKGDVSGAKTFIASGYSTPVQQEAFSPDSSVASLEEEQSSVFEAVEEIDEPVEPVAATKTERRRGRKPAKKSLTHIRDKALRKKEQNKTAATRYRLKKKKELVVTLNEEEQLQQVHDELSKQKDKITSEVRMIRNLLREMLQARKQRIAPAVSVSASRLTASSLVRVANRRK